MATFSDKDRVMTGDQMVREESAAAPVNFVGERDCCSGETSAGWSNDRHNLDELIYSI